MGTSRRRMSEEEGEKNELIIMNTPTTARTRLATVFALSLKRFEIPPFIFSLRHATRRCLFTASPCSLHFPLSPSRGSRA